MIKGAIKFLAKDTAVYGIAGAVSKFIAVFTVPIIVRILTKEDYGVLTAVISTSAIFVGVITLGMDSSVARWFFDKQDDFSYRRTIVSTGFFIQLLALILFAPVMVLGSDYLGLIIFDGNHDMAALWKWYMIGIPASAFVLFSQNIFKWNFQRNYYLILSLGMSAFSVSLTLFFLLWLKMGVFGAVLAPVISSLLFSILGIYLNRKLISFKHIGNKLLILDMLKYGWPFAVIIILGAAIPSVDKLFLLRLVNLVVLGEYAVAVKIANLLLVIVSAFRISFGPYAFSIWKKKEAPLTFSKLAEYYFTAMMVLSVLMSAFAEFGITIFAGEQYLSSRIVLPFLTLGIAINGMRQFTLLGITWAKKTMFNLGGSILMFTSLLIFNFVLTPRYFQVGAAIAILLTELLYVGFTFVVSQKYYHIPLRWLRFIFVLCVSGMVQYLFVNSIATYQVTLIFVGYVIVVISIWNWWPLVLKKNDRDWV